MDPISINDLTTQQLNALVGAGISVGTLYCFLGYRTLKVLIGLTGFCIAGMTAATLASLVSEGEVSYMAFAGIIGGLFGAMALSFLYRTGVFFIGVLGAALIASNCLAAQGSSWVPLAVIGMGLVGGLVALLVERPVITVSSAAIGAWIVVSGVAYFMYDASWLQEWGRSFAEFKERNIVLACWAILAVAGTFMQIATRKRPMIPA